MSFMCKTCRVYCLWDSWGPLAIRPYLISCGSLKSPSVLKNNHYLKKNLSLISSLSLSLSLSMALSCSVSLTAASGWPFPQNRNSERVKPILKEFKPTLPSTQKWSVSQKQTLAFGPTKQYPITINNVIIFVYGFCTCNCVYQGIFNEMFVIF
jgi:hypothetical protein